MNERFLVERTPLNARYKRVLEGKVLTEAGASETATGLGLGTATSPRALQTRDRLYKRILLPEATSTWEADINSNGAVTDADANADIFVAPILFPSLSLGRSNVGAGAGIGASEPTRPRSAAAGRKRILQSTPIKVLDAPGLEDDFYQNLLDWDHVNNRLAVLLNGNEVYFWDARNLSSSSSRGSSATAAATQSLGRARLTGQAKGCVVKVGPGEQLALGTRTGVVELWDPHRGHRVTALPGHPETRCGVLSWQSAVELSSGGRDGRVVHYDLRTPRGAVGESCGHSQEICGLRWDPISNNCASGGNDNLLFIWDRRHSTRPLLKLTSHCAAVKALAWSPHQSGLLASGGGTADRTIRFWNTKRAQSLWNESPIEGFGSEPLDSPAIPEQLVIQASSQVCTLAWSPLCPEEVLSTHGFSEHNLALWSYPSGRCIGRFEGHSQRVLFQATGPDGTSVCTGSGDQTLRFWNVFRPAARPATGGHNKRRARAVDSIIFDSCR